MKESPIASGSGPFARDITRALGLEHVKRIVLTIDVREGVTVEIHRFVTEEELSRIGKTIERHEMKAKSAFGEDD